MKIYPAIVAMALLLVAAPFALAANGDGMVVSYKPDVASTGDSVTLQIKLYNDAADGRCIDEILIMPPDTWGGKAVVDKYSRSAYTYTNEESNNDIILVSDLQSVRIVPTNMLCVGETVDIEISGLVAPGSYEVSDIVIKTSDQMSNAGPSQVYKTIDTLMSGKSFALPKVYVTTATQLKLEYLHITDFSTSGFKGTATGASAKLKELYVKGQAGATIQVNIMTNAGYFTLYGPVALTGGIDTLVMNYAGWNPATMDTANLESGYIDDGATVNYQIVLSAGALQLKGEKEDIRNDPKWSTSGLTDAKGTIITAGTSDERKINVQLTDDKGYDVNEQIPLAIETDLGSITETPPYETDTDGNKYFTLEPECTYGIANVKISTDPLKTTPSVTEYVGIDSNVPYSFAVVEGDGAYVPAGGSQLIKVEVKDSCGNLVSNTHTQFVNFSYITATCGDKNKLAQTPGGPSNDYKSEYTNMGIADVYLNTNCQLCTHDVEIKATPLSGSPKIIHLYGVNGPPAKMQVTVDDDDITADQCVIATIKVVDACGNLVSDIPSEVGNEMEQWESIVRVTINESLYVDQPGWASHSQTWISKSDFREEYIYNYVDTPYVQGKLNRGVGYVTICGCQGLGTFDIIAISDTIEEGRDTVNVKNAAYDCIEVETVDQLLVCEKTADINVAIKDICGNYITNQACGTGGQAEYCVNLGLGEGCDEGAAELDTETVCVDVGNGGPGYLEIPATLLRNTEDCCELEITATRGTGCCGDFPILEQCDPVSVLFHGKPAYMTTQFFKTRKICQPACPPTALCVEEIQGGQAVQCYEQLHEELIGDEEVAPNETVSEEVLDLFTVYDACNHIVKDYDGTVDVEVKGEDCASIYQVDHPFVESDGICVENGDLIKDGCSEYETAEACEQNACEWIDREECQDAVVKKLVIHNCKPETVKQWIPLENDDLIVDKLAFKMDYYTENMAMPIWVYIFEETETTPGFQGGPGGDRLVGKAPMSPVTIIELEDSATPYWDDQRQGGVLIRAGDSRDFYIVLVNKGPNANDYIPCGVYDADFLYFQDYNSPDITNFGSGYPDSNGDGIIDTDYFNTQIGTAGIEGVQCLFTSQMVNGGWEDSGATEYNEYTGEAARAIASLGEYSAIIRGADRLLQTQNMDGGWNWQTGTPSHTNVLGVTAYGVLRAYQMTGEQKYMDSLEKAYDYANNAVPVYTGNKETTLGVDSCPDITWLVEMSELTGDSKYANLAKERYDQRIAAFGGADAFADYLVSVRPDGLAPWDIDLCVKAAKALNVYYGEKNYADDKTAMAKVSFDAMYGISPTFDPSNPSEGDYVIGLAGAIDTFRVTSIGNDKLDSLVDYLLGAQKSNGCWQSEGSDDAQATAYAVLELQQLAYVEDYCTNSDNFQWLQPGPSPSPICPGQYAKGDKDARNDDYLMTTPDYGFGDRFLYNLPFKEGQAWMKFRDLVAENVNVYTLSVDEQGDVCGYGDVELDSKVQPNPEEIEFLAQPATQIKLINHDNPPKTAVCSDEWDVGENAYSFNIQVTDGFDNPVGKEVEVSLDYCLKMPFGDWMIEDVLEIYCMTHGDEDICEDIWYNEDRCFTREDLKKLIEASEYTHGFNNLLFGDYFGQEFSDWIDNYFQEAKVEFWDGTTQAPLPFHGGKQIVTTDESGQAQIYVTAQKTGMYKIIARPLALDGDWAMVSFEGGIPYKLDLMALPSFGIPADGEEEAMLFLRALDECGNLVHQPISSVTVAVTQGEQVYISQDFECKNNYDGDVTGTLYSGFLGETCLTALSDLPQTATITASSYGLESDSTSIKFQGAPVKLAITEISPSDRLPADGQTGAWVTIQVQDIHNNRVTGYLGDGFSGDPADPWGFTDYTFETICIDLDDTEAGIMDWFMSLTDIQKETYGWVNFHQVSASQWCGDLMFGEGKVYVTYGNPNCNHGGTVNIKVWDPEPFQGQEFDENGLPASLEATQLTPAESHIDFVDPATQWNLMADKAIALADGKSTVRIEVQVENPFMDVRQAVEGVVYIGGAAQAGAALSWDGIIDGLNPTSARFITDPTTGKTYLELTSTAPGIAEITVTGGDAYICQYKKIMGYECPSCKEVYSMFMCHYSCNEDLTPKTIEVEFLEVATKDVCLDKGWNFISVPYLLDGSKNQLNEIFNYTNIAGNAYGWNAATQSWTPLTGSSTLQPLEGYWIKAVAPECTTLVYATPTMPSIPTKAVSQGWNAVGLAWDSPITMRNALMSINNVYSNVIGWIAGLQKYGIPVANTGGDGPFETGGVNMEPKQGYWVWSTGSGTLAGLAA